MGPDLSMYPEAAREALAKAIEFQQNSYELSSDWNLYEKTEHEYLKKNIRYSIGGRPDTGCIEDDCTEMDCGEEKSEEDKVKDEQEEEKRRLNEERLDKIVETVYERIVEASRTKDSLYVGMLFNVLCNIDGVKAAKEKKEEEEDEDKADQPIPVPVFKVKRCMENGRVVKPRLKENGKKSKIGVKALYPWCTCYVDVEGRVYKNWTDYVTNNTLPKCLMVLPMGGFYQENPSAFNTENKTYVWIEIGPSPAAGTILPFVDTASSVLGVGALGVGLAAIATPIAAPVLIAGTVIGAVSGVYATARSTQTLVDRAQHQQSISPSDRAARSAWLGVAGGLAGGLASGSTMLLSKAAKAGVTLGAASRTAYNAIAIGNIVVNGAGIGNGIYSMYKNYQDGNKVSKLEIAQVVAHILFFGNAVMNFKTAKTIINDTQQTVLQEYENGLRSNRHRRAFRRIRRSTQASNGDATLGDSEIIRGIRSITNKDDFFAGVVRSRKILSASNAEVTFKDGYATINNDVKIDPMEFSQQPTEVKVNLVNAAESFNAESVKSTFSNSSTKMPIAVFKDEYLTIVVAIRNGIALAQHPITADGIEYVKRLVFELQNFTGDNKSKVIENLARIALEVVKRMRKGFDYRRIEEFIFDLWLYVVKPKVEKIFKDWDIDLSNVTDSGVVRELIFSVTTNVLDEIFDGVENFLEEIIESFSRHSTELANTSGIPTCSTCSGYILIDS